MKKVFVFLIILLGVGAFLIESSLIKDVFSKPTRGANRSGTNDVDWFAKYDPQETIADCAAGAGASGEMYNSDGPSEYYNTWSYR